jgi:hypothetical protein
MIPYTTEVVSSIYPRTFQEELNKVFTKEITDHATVEYKINSRGLMTAFVTWWRNEDN